MVAWRCGRLRHKLNFPDIVSLDEDEFLAPLFRVMSHMEELQTRQEYLRLHTQTPHRRGVPRRTPGSCAGELDFYTEKDMKRATFKAKKKKRVADDAHKNKKRAAMSTSRGEAGPTIIYVELSGSELDDAF
jgi:hypothetical protein